MTRLVRIDVARCKKIGINACQRVRKCFGIFLVGIAAKLSFASPLPNRDFQLWNNLTAMGPLAGKVRYWLEGQARIGDDASRLSQLLLRPGIGYEVGDNSTVWLGYAYINTRYPFTRRSVDENRLWEQFLWVGDYQWGRIFSRTRLEQRFIDAVATTGWRFRQFARVQRLLDKHGKIIVAAAEELFISINNTAREGSNRGFRQNRIFVGIGYLASSTVLMEVGYQNQYIRRINQRNYVGNYVATNVILNF